MDILIKWNDDKESLQFPVNPSSFSQGLSQNNTSLYIHDFGEMNLKGKRALKTISWSSFFPSRDYYFAKVPYKEPYDYYIKKLNSLLEKNTTVHLVITETDINMYATIESFAHGEEEKNGDVSYSIDFKEYRVPTSKKQASNRASSSASTTKPKSKITYTWRKGDTWPKVCKKKLGTSKNFKKVRKNNISVIKKAQKAFMKKHPHEGASDGIILVGYKVVLKK